MAVIEGVQICTTSARTGRASGIIARMEQLLAQRRRFQTSRKQFLDRWQKLRKALLITNDYQQLIERVRERANGTCQYCSQRPGVHVHHEVPVAFEPQRVLDDSICKWTCGMCHEPQDKKARLRARRDRRRADRSIQLPRQPSA